jgi:hypothetical protein
MTGRVSLLMAALMLAGMASLTSIALADEESEAPLQRQLEEVRQQLHELQLKVQHMEAEQSAAQAPSAPVDPAAPVVGPSTGGHPPPAPPVQPATGAAAAPSAPAVETSSTGNQPLPAAVGAETGTSPPPSAAPESSQRREMLRDQWRGIKAGMSRDEIRGLLGSPSRELIIDGKPLWYYSYPGIGNGSVLFSRDSHTVAAWQHPPFGFEFW